MFLPEYRLEFQEKAAEPIGGASPMWPMHAALAAIWASEPETAIRLIQLLEDCIPRAAWVTGAGSWLRGLASELVEDLGAARRHLDEAIETGLARLAVFHAHAHSDRARLAARCGDRDAAVRDRAAAEATLFSPLTDRERDVAALVLAGMSYAQIGQELYITRSTVGFHLSRIYAKTGTTTRHELIDLARRAV